MIDKMSFGQIKWLPGPDLAGGLWFGDRSKNAPVNKNQQLRCQTRGSRTTCLGCTQSSSTGKVYTPKQTFALTPQAEQMHLAIFFSIVQGCWMPFSLSLN